MEYLEEHDDQALEPRLEAKVIMTACGLVLDGTGEYQDMRKKCIVDRDLPVGKVRGHDRRSQAKKSPTEKCPVYACCVRQRSLPHCGLCEKFPCKKYLDLELPCTSIVDWEQKKEEALHRLFFKPTSGELKYWYDEYLYLGPPLLI